MIAFLVLTSSLAMAAEQSVPPALRPWIPWVLATDEAKAAQCPVPHGQEGPECAWPSRLSLSLHAQGGTFTQTWRLFRDAAVALPGDRERWPSQVLVNGKPATVADETDGPTVYLPAGNHTITGRFVWDSLPEEVQVPADSALVTLTVDGHLVSAPERHSDGRLFLGPTSGDKAEPDAVDLAVFRKLTDGAPVRLETRIDLKVSGKNRELRLARVLPDGFEVTRIDSALPLRLDDVGHAILQAKPGAHSATLYARRNASVVSVARPTVDGVWMDGQEVWAFEEQPDFRRVTVTGAPAIDPAQTQVPDVWRTFPAYAMAPGGALSLNQQSRGDTQAEPDHVVLQRTLWLDVDGRGWSASDEIMGTFRQTARLEAEPSLHLGRVQMDGHETFITRLGPSGRAGVELPKWRPNMKVESRLARAGSALAANGYGRAFDQATAVVNLPPGYRLLHAAGADEVSGTWVQAWTVLDLCLLVLCVLMTAKLFGLRVGAIALLALGLVFVERDAPRVAWLVLLVGELARRYLRDGKNAVVALFARWVRPVTFAWLGVSVFLFAVDRVSWVAAPISVADLTATDVPTWLKQKAPEDRFASLLLPAEQKRADENAKNAGIGYLKMSEGSHLASIFGRDTAAGRDAENALGGLVGNEIGEAYGVGGLGLTGTGAPSENSGYGRRRHRGEEGKMGHGKENLYALKGQRDMSVPPAPRPKAVEYDPSVQVQTGFGMPAWSAPAAFFSFRSQVDEGRTMRLYLLPPWATRSLTLVQIALLILLVRVLWRRSKSGPLAPGLSLAPVALALLVALAPRPAAAQEIPDAETLKSLREHLQPEPACRPRCASLDEMALDVDAAELRVRLRGSAVAPTAIALPTDMKTWTPTQVLLGGQPARALRNDSGQLWLVVPAGVFAVDLRGPTLHRESISLPMRMPPHRVKTTVRAYAVDGVHEDGAVDDSVQLTLQPDARSATEAAVVVPTLPAFLQISRTLILGTKWTVHTEVARQGDSGAPVVADVPLLPGEAVATPRIRVDNAKRMVNVNLGPTEKTVEWDSTLAEQPMLRLWFDPATAPRLFERWSVEVAGTWHAQFEGIAPVAASPTEANRRRVYHPFPDEAVVIRMDKLTGASGQSLTIDASALTLTLGERAIEAQLQLVARTSRGTDHVIGLPAGARVDSVRRDGTTQAIERDGQRLRLTLLPGRHTIDVAFRLDASPTLFFQTPAVDLGAPSVNHHTVWTFPRGGRFLLWLDGPSGGPVVHWAFVLVAFVVIAALAATRLRRLALPFGFSDWLLLLIGLSLVGWAPALGLAVTLVLLVWRNTRQLDPSLYNVSQVAIGVGFTLAAAAWIVAFVGRGFMQPPCALPWLQPWGPSLHWMQDRVSGALPQPWMVSLPVWTYHAFLVALALWLSWRLPRFARQLWQAFRQQGLWKAPVIKAS
jgi:hypothetical protein